jgi:hypothetical protein
MQAITTIGLDIRSRFSRFTGSIRREARLASVSRIGDVTKPDFRTAAKRFIRWRKKYIR